MNIFIDIETCPAQNPAVLQSLRESIAGTFKAPSTLTKEQAALELGLTDKDEIKFTSKDSMVARWVDKFRVEASEAAAQEAWRKTSFDGSCGHICVIGMAIEDRATHALWRKDFVEHESAVLLEFFRIVDMECEHRPNVQPTFVGHNLVAFDLRFIMHRAMVLNVKPSRHIPFNARSVGDRAVFDTMTAWAGYGNRISLDKLAGALGVGGKGDIDGSMVWDMVKDGRLREVAKYCMDDVDLTRKVFNRMTFAPVVELADCEF
jgi:predicted PolB exonuclease-like 3'-5' exonuclease